MYHSKVQPLCKEVEWVLLLGGPSVCVHSVSLIWDMSYETLQAIKMVPA